MMAKSALIVMMALAYVQAGDPEWNTAMNAIQVQCYDTATSQTPIVFAGALKEECDDDTHEGIVYAPTDTHAHWDMVIDPRNPETIDWDTARYKRYGTYWPTANITWNVPKGFTNFWARIYYANDNDKKFEPMKYQFSKDGKSWTDVPNVQYDGNVVCVQGNCNWYKRKEETATWTEPMFYFKAIWPAPCAGEIGHTYSEDQRVCLSLPPPGWTGTIEEFDASPLKDLYYTPQMGELHLGVSDETPGQPTNLKMTPGLNSVLLTWDAPATGRDIIIGYVVYYQLASIGSATAVGYSPPYLAKHVNVGHVSGVVLMGLDPAKLVIARVAAVTSRGSGPSSLNVWETPLAAGAVPACPAPLPSLAPTPPATTTGDTASPGSASSTKAAQTGSATLLLPLISFATIVVVAFAL